MREGLNRALIVAGVAFCVTPWASPALALGLGIALALAGLASPGEAGRKGARWLIQVGVVLLGFGMDLNDVMRAGATGLTFAAGTILGTFAAGVALGRILGCHSKVTTLLCSGTAICGGSAIVAVGGAIGATGPQISVAAATVYVLNGVALTLFPPIGAWLELSQAQFGVWAAVAIHDMSSVVGAGAAYGQEALHTATVVKMSRVLWIVPIALVAGWFYGRGHAADSNRKGPPVPWFVALFLVAAAARTAVGSQWPAEAADVGGALGLVAKRAMFIALFLIGAGLSRKEIAQVGWRPMVLGVALWVFISAAALVVVRLTLA